PLARHQEDASQALARGIRGDPAALARGVEAGDELGGDLRHQRLELAAVAVLLVVDRPVALDDPAHVPRPVTAQAYLARGGGAEGAAEGAQGGRERAARRRRGRGQHGAPLLLGTPLERREPPPAGGGERQRPAARVRGEARPRQQLPGLEALEDAAQ